MVHLHGFRFLCNFFISHLGIVLHLISNIGCSSDESCTLKYVVSDVSLTHSALKIERNVFLEINACAYSKSIREMGNLNTGIACCKY